MEEQHASEEEDDLPPWEAVLFCSGIQALVEAADDVDPGTRLRELKAVDQYVRWVHRNTPHCEHTAYIAAYVYVRRLMEWQEKTITSLDLTDTLLTSIVVAAKNMSQSTYNNAHYAWVGDMSTKALNQLEMQFLSDLSFRLHVDSEDFESCYAHLEWIHRERTCLQKLTTPI